VARGVVGAIGCCHGTARVDALAARPIDEGPAPDRGPVAAGLGADAFVGGSLDVDAHVSADLGADACVAIFRTGVIMKPDELATAGRREHQRHPEKSSPPSRRCACTPWRRLGLFVRPGGVRLHADACTTFGRPRSTATDDCATCAAVRELRIEIRKQIR
jgi:hypothetical protein